MQFCTILAGGARRKVGLKKNTDFISACAKHFSIVTLVSNGTDMHLFQSFNYLTSGQNGYLSQAVTVAH